MTFRVASICGFFLLSACGGVPRLGAMLPMSDGTFTHDGTIAAGQRVAFSQVLVDGPAVACVEARKPAGVELRGHLETVRLVDGDAVPMRSGVSWRAPPNLTEWQGWCEPAGDLRAGDLVRLVSEVAASGSFRFRVTLHAP